MSSESWEKAEKVVREMRVNDRQLGMRHALKVIGCCDQTVELIIEREREWIESMSPLEGRVL